MTETVDERLSLLYALGGGRGANRIAGGDAERAACELVAQWMDEAGLEVERDAFGNVIARLRGAEPQLPEVWTGSHVDSVPEGGRYDGALGVVAGIEAVAAVGPSTRTLGVVAFRDEERGCFGSLALGDGCAPGPLPRAARRAGARCSRRRGAPLGVVTGIVGSTRRELVFEGTAGHAGTTPMDARDDALAKAAEFVLRARDAARAIDGTVATVGRLEVEPGAANVIPGRVRLTVDVRAPDEERLTRLLETLGLEPGHDLAPVALDKGIRAMLREELERRSLAAVELPSGAGHDAGVLAARGVETGMLFVRSLNGGISHSPDELTSNEDVGLALDVLTAALRRLSAR